jgi:hypothetical protein
MTKWIDRAESRFGHLAIPNLIRIVAAFNALVFVLYHLSPHFLEWLVLDPALVAQGQVWRLVTYIFIPSMGGPIAGWFFGAIYIVFMWWVGDGLESVMGSFRVNLYYLLGMIGTTIAAFFFGTNFSATMLNASLFYAFARFYPELTIYVMFVLPMKVKWLAWIGGFFLILGFLGNGTGYSFAVLAALANFLVFFGAEIVQDAKLRRQVSTRRRKFESASRSEESAMHRCATCGKTDATNPELDFRVSRDGNEYCTAHLPAKQP